MKIIDWIGNMAFDIFMFLVVAILWLVVGILWVLMIIGKGIWSIINFFKHV